MVRQPTALGCYIFAGGFTLGVAEHFRVLGHLEHGPFGVETFKLNFPSIPVETDPQRWAAALPRERVDFLYSNPPCAPWSAAGASLNRGGGQWKTDDRVGCVRNSVAIGLRVRPRVWVWESVPRAFTLGRDVVDSVSRTWMREGYRMYYLLFDLVHLSTGQQRRRFYCVASRIDLDFKPPDGRVISAEQSLKPVKKLSYISPMSPAWVELLKHVKPGEGLRDVWERRVLKPDRQTRLYKTGRQIIVGRPHLMAHRVDPSKPAGVITSVVAHVHWKHPRWLGHEELLKLGGWPLTYRFAGKPGGWQSEIAKAVQPAAGEYVARQVARNLRRPDFRGPPPDPVTINFIKRTSP